MKIYSKEQIPQRSDLWHKIRANKMTASNADRVIANGTGLKTYCYELVTEYLSQKIPEQIVNDNLLRGVLLEEQAATYCSLLTGEEWEEIGFVEVDTNVGCSPDRVIIENGKITKILEIKCPNDKNFLELILTEEIPTKYIYQMNFQMMCCELETCKYFAYNPNIKPYYYMEEIKADKTIQDKLQIGLEHGKEIIKELLNEYKSKTGIKLPRLAGV